MRRAGAKYLRSNRRAGIDPPNRHKVPSLSIPRGTKGNPPCEVRTALVAEHHTRFPDSREGVFRFREFARPRRGSRCCNADTLHGPPVAITYVLFPRRAVVSVSSPALAYLSRERDSWSAREESYSRGL
jgi:hypothetical protein